MSFTLSFKRYNKRTMKSSSSVTKKTRTSSSKPKAEKIVVTKVEPKKIVRRAPLTTSDRIKRRSKTIFKAALLSKSFQSSVKVLSICLVAGSSLYGVYHLVSKTFANEVVISKSEIVSRVSKLTPLPEGSPRDVVRVEDENNLKKQNEFYKDVKEGDYVLMYKDMAIIYDLRNNSIVAMRRTLDAQNEEKSARIVPSNQAVGTSSPSLSEE